MKDMAQLGLTAIEKKYHLRLTEKQVEVIQQAEYGKVYGEVRRLAREADCFVLNLLSAEGGLIFIVDGEVEGKIDLAACKIAERLLQVAEGKGKS